MATSPLGRAAILGFALTVLGLVAAAPALAGPCPPPQTVCLPEEPAPPPPGQDGISSVDVYVGDASAEAIQSLLAADLVGPLAALAAEPWAARPLTDLRILAFEASLYRWVVGLAGSLLGLALLAAILQAVARRATALPAEGWPALLGRLGLAAGGIAALPFGVTQLAALSAALARLLGGDRLGELYLAGRPGDGIGGALVSLALVVLFALLLLQALGRLALVNLLALLGPLALAGLVAPQTRDWPGRWARLLLATLFAPVLQVALIALALALRASFAEPARSIFALAAAYAVYRAPTLLLGDAGGLGRLVILAAGGAAALGGRIAERQPSTNPGRPAPAAPAGPRAGP